MVINSKSSKIRKSVDFDSQSDLSGESLGGKKPNCTHKDGAKKIVQPVAHKAYCDGSKGSYNE